VIEWGFRRGLRAPPKKLVVLDERSRLWDLFRGGGRLRTRGWVRCRGRKTVGLGA
jgi:hypothetical protein